MYCPNLVQRNVAVTYTQDRKELLHGGQILICNFKERINMRGILWICDRSRWSQYHIKLAYRRPQYKMFLKYEWDPIFESNLLGQVLITMWRLDYFTAWDGCYVGGSEELYKRQTSSKSTQCQNECICQRRSRIYRATSRTRKNSSKSDPSIYSPAKYGEGCRYLLIVFVPFARGPRQWLGPTEELLASRAGQA